MRECGFVKELAREVLLESSLTGECDSFFWDRARRLVRNIEQICQLPEVRQTKFPIDRFSLSSAAYFCEAGLARYMRAEKRACPPTFYNGNDGELTELTIGVVEEKLGGHIEKPDLAKINEIIIESQNRFTKMPEAMILFDARNLEDMGLVGVFNGFRRHISDGKDVSGILKNWQRKIDYKYWQARIEESFRFQQVRKIAKRRLSAAENFMKQLGLENNASDFQGFSAGYRPTEKNHHNTLQNSRS